MKLTTIKILMSMTFFICLLCSAQVYAQAEPQEPKPGETPRHMQAKQEAQTKTSGAVAKTSDMVGEYNKNVDCVEMFVRKGCINYSVAAPSASYTDKVPVVKVCASKKPVNICRKGARTLNVKYEKLDADAVVDFKEVKAVSKESRQ